ncbi:tetratricopeptide repeat protein [Nannocystaceae bacterium ST9]
MPRSRERLATLSLAALTVGALLAGFAPLASAAPPDGEDWTLETHEDDDKLVAQRLSKLRANPFDAKQWRALEQSIGRGSLVARITSASERDPDDVVLQILRAKGDIVKGDPKAGADRLAKLSGKAGRWEKKVFDMRVDALEEAKAWSDAVSALETEAGKRSKKDGEPLLERAFGLADRAAMHDKALELAEQLSAANPKDPDATVRVARAARAAGKPDKADESFELAIGQAKGDAKLELMAERALAKLDAGKPAEAGKLLWELLDDESRGRSDQRETWWEDLETCYRKDARSEVLADEIEKWLDDAKHAREVAAWQALARAQKAAGRNPIPALRKAIDLAPKDPIARAALIEALEEQGQSEAALEQYRALKGRSPEEIRLGLDMAERLLTNGERETGLQIAAEIAEIGARDGDALLLLIEFYNNVDEPDLALTTAKALVKLRGRDADARVALGEQLWEMGQREEALAQWEQLPKLIKPAHKGWFRHAEILADHATFDANLTNVAVDSIEKAIKAKPGDPAYLRLLAMLEEERRRPDFALATWEKVRAVADEPSEELLRAEARTRIVELIVGPGLPNRAEARSNAVADCEKALAKGASPEALEAGLFMAELHSREENYTAAVEMYTRLRDMFPNDPERLMELAIAQRRAGNAEEALRTLEKLLPLSPAREVDVLVMLTEISHELDKPEQAREAAVRALEQGSAGTRALLRLGELHERRGEIDQAMWCYQKVLDAQPDHARTRMRLAELQLTTGDIQGAAKSFRELLDAGGPGDLMKEAGARALDLAEVTESTREVLELAVKRTKREPNADEPRDFLLSTLDRIETREVEGWLLGASEAESKPTRDADRVAALRRPLIAALSRGSINNRLSAAQHLGELGLPDTAIHLARTGANLQPPHDATHAVQMRFIAARVAALEAAGALDDPESIPVLTEILDTATQHSRVRHAAFWALARSSHVAAAEPLRKRVRAGDDELGITLACLGLARLSRDDQRVEDLVIVDRIARATKTPAVRRACSFSAVALTPEFRVARLHPQLHDPDPFIAAIAAWRIGQVAPTKVRDVSLEALFGLWFGPSGLPRDAAAAALTRLLDADRKHTAAGIEAPPILPEQRWGTVVERWIEDMVAPDYAPLDTNDLTPHLDQVRAAWKQSMAGTRAEMAAAEQAVGACGSKSRPELGEGEVPEALCLEPLARGTLKLGR